MGIDEPYLIAGHKGQPLEVKKSKRAARRRRLGGKRGIVRRGSMVVIKMLENVRMATIEPIITATVEQGSKVYTDGYNIYNNMHKTYEHSKVNHGKGEYARDGDGDGINEVHVNTMESFWSLLRPWLRPHRGISQKKLPSYLGFFQFIHNIRKRGHEALGALIGILVST